MQKPNLSKIPKQSGVYLFKTKDKPLYIGKATDLKNRLNSYFVNKNKDSKISTLIQESKKLEWQITNSEIEALILESQLIKKLKPLFNIKLRDDKRYFYIVISQDIFPKIFITHQPIGIQKLASKNQDYKSNFKIRTSYIGPFTDGTALKTTLRVLRKVFPYCTCKQTHNVFCLNYHIGNCLGFCCLKDNPERSRRTVKNIKYKTRSQEHEYKKNIHAIQAILNGKKTILIKDLIKEMNNLAKKEEFQKAIELRNKLSKLQRVFENAKILHDTNKQIENNFKSFEMLKKTLRLITIPQRIEGYDIANIQGEFATGSMVTFINGQPDKNQYRKFKIRLIHQPNDIAMLKEVLMRRFRHTDWPMPDLIIVDGGKGQLNAANTILNSQFSILAPSSKRLWRVGDNKFSTKQLSTQKIIPIIALTKDKQHRGDHIFLSTKKSPIKLGDLPNEVKNLILNVNSEAHRFAISYYKKIHRIRLRN